MTKESVLGQVVDIKKEPESFQSATDELMAEMFTLQEVERMQEEGFDDFIIHGGGVDVRHVSCQGRHFMLLSFEKRLSIVEKESRGWRSQAL